PWDEVTRMRDAFKTRRDLVVDGLNAIDGISCVRPKGAFYAFPNISGTGQGSRAFADRLLQDFGVAALSGTAFGDHGEGFLRLSTANSEANLTRALERIAACAAG
ncbi:MAG: aminotransferase class I/II-fold pyridoxal phosphate-dependent enzyme, partial [Thermomicrobiales bacterium]